MKLTIKNLQNIHGKSVTNDWEIKGTQETNDDYYFELTNKGYKNWVHGAWIERMKYDDSYRLHSSDYKGNNIESYIEDVTEAGVITALNEMFDKLNKQ